MCIKSIFVNWGSLRRSHRPLVGCWGDTPPHVSSLSTPSTSQSRRIRNGCDSLGPRDNGFPGPAVARIDGPAPKTHHSGPNSEFFYSTARITIHNAISTMFFFSTKSLRIIYYACFPPRLCRTNDKTKLRFHKIFIINNLCQDSRHWKPYRTLTQVWMEKDWQVAVEAVKEPHFAWISKPGRSLYRIVRSYAYTIYR